MKTQRELMQDVARYLTGKPVIVRLEFKGYPRVGEGKTAMASTYKDRDGNPVIVVYEAGWPPQSGKEQARYFLHECGHVLCHADQLAPMDSPTPADLKEYVTDKGGACKGWEENAEAVAQKWLVYAVGNVRPFERENFGGLLRALLNAPLGEV